MAEKKQTQEQLNEVINRLINENKLLREKLEAAEIIIRQRAPAAEVLSLRGAIKSILDERDSNAKRIDFFRKQLSKTLKLLLSGDLPEAKRQLNLFLFNNPR